MVFQIRVNPRRRFDSYRGTASAVPKTPTTCHPERSDRPQRGRSRSRRTSTKPTLPNPVKAFPLWRRRAACSARVGRTLLSVAFDLPCGLCVLCGEWFSQIRVDPRRRFDSYRGTASAVPKTPTTCHPERSDRPQRGRSRSRRTPTRPTLPSRLKASPRGAAVQPAQPVWDGHSCPPPLIFPVTLCFRGEWFFRSA
jgi:hypothetical protein